MNEQIQYITTLSAQYKIYSGQSEELFNTVNQIPESTTKAIYEYYSGGERFQPVNVLRAEIARELLARTVITKELVEQIKEKIRTGRLETFASFSAEKQQELNYFIAGDETWTRKRDMFAGWQNYWRVFYPFFYRGKTKETVQLYLEQIGKRLVQDLEIPDYTIHWVDFQGMQNFGADYCWMALYPQSKSSHKDAHQFFLRFNETVETGRVSGSHLGLERHHTREVLSYDEILSVLQELKPEIVRLNQQIRNYFKFAPGEQAKHWERFRQEGIAALSYSNFQLNDISHINSREELNLAAGLPAESQSNETWNLWLFKTANVGDVVFASRGVSTCFGIGLIKGEYYFDGEADDYPHRRKVNWITDKVYQYAANALKGYKTLFRPDTFSPTKVSNFIFSEYVRLYPELKVVFDEHHLKYSETEPTEAPKTDIEIETDETEAREINYWWLNANPNIWKLSDVREGERQTYTSRNEKGNKRRIYKHFEIVQPGDWVIGYESTPTKQVKAVLEITKPLHQTEEGEVIELELIEKLEIPIFRSELENNAGLQNCEPFTNSQGSLFKLTEDEYDIIREVIDAKNIAQEARLVSSEIKPYNFKTDADKPFISEKDFLQTVELLRRKKNIILQGAPGVGKTFIARKLAYQLMGFKNDANIETVQFHQSYSYEDFIQGLRPSKNGFELRNGVFYTFCQQALAHPERSFFLVIDEINRGNLSKIFGELMMLIEADKRSDKFALKMTYSEDEADRFFVPPNLYIIGTMNTADRSLAIVDYALRRRFAFINLQPEFGEKFVEFLQNSGIKQSTVEFIRASIGKVNQEITRDINLGSGFQIGHSYFCTKNGETDESDWLNEIINFEIKPLLEEIWFDDAAKVEEMMRILTA